MKLTNIIGDTNLFEYSTHHLLFTKLILKMKKGYILSCLMILSLPSFAQQTDFPIEKGAYSPTWESVSSWTCPEWYEDAKFGIWAHWGPQCEAEDGDWYARFMYYPNTQQWSWQTSHFGSPTVFGLKDLINVWKAEKWTPDSLVKLYKDAGAQYFMTLGNHHDNFDLWNSPYQEWNSVNMGPKKDIVKGWSDACDKYGLPFGVSIHASHAWTWLEPSQPYDGNLTKDDGYLPNNDGTEKWWKGYDPQELYAQRHAHSTGWDNSGTIHSQWGWGNGASVPSDKYMMKFQNRVLQLINDYNPKMLYFDDTVLPFWGVTDSIGLNILSDYYNHSAKQHNGEQQVVVMGKILDDNQKNALLWDVERGIPDRPQKRHWQTCTCIGDWHYNQSVYNNNGYKSAAQVIRMLVDIVSKNGNLLLSVPVKANGTIDDKEEAIVKGIGAWMNINKNSIYSTRPWKTFGEGPLAEAVNPMTAQGFNENNNYSNQDIRYVQRNDTVFATIMAWPSAGEYPLKSFAVTSPYYSGQVNSVELLGYGKVNFRQDNDALMIDIPASHPNDIAPVFQITLGESLTAWNQLQQLINVLDEKTNILNSVANYNTGKLSLQQVSLLKIRVAEAKSISETAGETVIKDEILKLTSAYHNLNNFVNKGGLADTQGTTDITQEFLLETSNFSRIDNSTTRFSTPKNWVVDNFKIAQNNSDGTKNGIDRFPGFNCLMLGLWNDRQNSLEGNLADARIYRKVHLTKGQYYFGGAFDTHYNLSKGYIFVSGELPETSNLGEKSIAFYPITKVADGNDAYGVYFSLAQDQDVYLGFQADLNSGSATQEMRVKSVKLLKYNDIAFTDLEGLISKAQLMVAGAKINDNTGYYSQSTVNYMKALIAEALQVNSQSSSIDIYNAYELLKLSCERFNKDVRNAGGNGDIIGASEITNDQLVESSNFTPVDGTDPTKRFASPKYWTVDNFNIPQSDNSGTKAGLDHFTGQYSISLGLWNDRSKNTIGSLSDARIYHKISLKKGRYYFGATYDNTWMPVKGYMFASEQLVHTTAIEDSTLAFYSLANCTTDGSFNGMYFTLEKDADVNVGFQCDLLQGNETQEFRAKQVKLLMIADTSTGIEVHEVAQGQTNTEYYSLGGIRLANPPEHGAFIIRSEGKAKVLMKK